MLKVTHTEHGYDFITLYFKRLEHANEYAKLLYRKLKEIKPELTDINRLNFAHKPGDQSHFHTDGEPGHIWPKAFRHFHIMFPNKPKQDDWEFLYKVGNDKRLKLQLDRGLVTREVQGGNNVHT